MQMKEEGEEEEGKHLVAIFCFHRHNLNFLYLGFILFPFLIEPNRTEQNRVELNIEFIIFLLNYINGRLKGFWAFENSIGNFFLPLIWSGRIPSYRLFINIHLGCVAWPHVRSSKFAETYLLTCTLHGLVPVKTCEPASPTYVLPICHLYGS